MNQYRFLLAALLLIVFNVRTVAQTKMAISVTVLGPGQEPVPKATLTLTELGSQQKKTTVTNASGEGSFEITVAGEWKLTVNGHDTGQEPVVIGDGDQGSVAFQVTHNPARDLRLRKQQFDRSGFATVPMPAPFPRDPEKGWNLVEIQVVSSSGRTAAGLPVALVSLGQKQQYVASTDAGGVARFYVPGAQPYDIDVAEQLNAGYLLMEARAGYSLTQEVMYDAYDLNEKRRGDTIIQQLTQPLTQKASRALYELQVRRGGKLWRHGTVYIDATGTAQVYTARTDSSGKAVVLLPFGRRYLVHFPFHRDVDVINLLDARQQAWGSTDLEYRPDPRLEFPERYLPAPRQLTLTHFTHFHKTPYPPAPGTTPSLQATVVPVGGASVLHIGIGGRAAAQNERSPLNAAFVLDVSASMAGYDRIESLKRGLQQLVGELRPNDRIALITFNDRMRLVRASQLVGKDKEAIGALVAGIEPSGGTNMLAALEAGYREVSAHLDRQYENRVVLLSDGFDSNSDSVLVAAQAPWRDRIPLQAIGVGSDYNSAVLARLSTHGLPKQVPEGRELERIVGELVRTQSLLADRLVLTIEPEAGVTVKKIYGADSIWRAGTSWKANLPRLPVGSDIPVLAVIESQRGAEPASMPVRVSLEYFNQMSKSKEQLQASARPPLDEPLYAKETGLMLTLAAANEALTEAARLGQEKKFKSAEEAASAGIGMLATIPNAAKEPELNKVLEQLQQLQKALRTALRAK